MSGPALFTDHERRVLRSHDRALDRIDARFAGVRWYVPRPVVRGATCPHGVSILKVCEACPEWGAP